MDTFLNAAFYAASIPGAHLELAPLFFFAALVAAVGVRWAMGGPGDPGDDNQTE